MMGSHDASFDGVVPVYTAIVEAVAETKGVDPLSLEPPLYDVLDPEALDALCDSTTRCQSPVHVEFVYSDCTVTVAPGGTIVVEC